jgi:hypothetical protein
MVLSAVRYPWPNSSNARKPEKDPVLRMLCDELPTLMARKLMLQHSNSLSSRAKEEFRGVGKGCGMDGLWKKYIQLLVTCAHGFKRGKPTA